MSPQPIEFSSFSSVSLFSGIGGLDIGLHNAGFSPLLCCEVDVNALETLEYNLSQRNSFPIYKKDVNELSPKEVLKLINKKPGELDLLAGGPPCQAFSLIGKRNSLNDDRGILLYKMSEFAKVLRPKAILIEQVKGLLSAPCEDNIKGGALTKLVKQLKSLGYHINYRVVLAASYGVPQLRERLIIVGSLNKPFEFPDASHRLEPADDLFNAHAKFVDVRSAIGNLPAPTLNKEQANFPNHVDITPARDRERINGVPEGECLAKQLHLPKEQRMNLSSKDTTKFRRLSWELPALTLRGGEAFYHPEENRYLTPREYLRLHGYDDNFILFGPIKGRSGTFKSLDQHRLVANSVPPPLAEVIGKAIVQQFFRSSKEKRKGLDSYSRSYLSA